MDNGLLSMARQGSQPELLVFDESDIGSQELETALAFYDKNSGSYEYSEMENMKNALAVYNGHNGYVLWHFGLFENNNCCAFGSALYSKNNRILLVDYIYTTSMISWPIYYGYMVDRIRSEFTRWYGNPDYILCEVPKQQQLCSNSGHRYEQARTLATLGFQLLDIPYEQPFFEPRAEATQGPVDDKHASGALAVRTRNQEEKSLSAKKVDDFIEFIYMVYYAKWPEANWNEATHNIYTHEMHVLKDKIQKQYANRGSVNFVPLPGNDGSISESSSSEVSTANVSSTEAANAESTNSGFSESIDIGRFILTFIGFVLLAAITITLDVRFYGAPFYVIAAFLILEFIVSVILFYFQAVPKNFGEFMHGLRRFLGLK